MVSVEKNTLLLSRMYCNPESLISFQNVSEHEKIHSGPLDQHIHNKKDLETRTTASSPSLQLTGQQKASRGEFL